ncbi:MAG: patatin-like phospholipase family protein [Gemmatimonadota bacterium]
MLNEVARRIRLLDSRLRHFDFRANRTVGGVLGRHGVSRHTTAALFLPALIVLFAVNGPALRPTQRLAIAVGAALAALLVFSWTLRYTARRSNSYATDLFAQIALLTLAGAVVWLCASAGARERSDDLLYRHVLVPVIGIVCISLIVSAGFVAGLFSRPREGLSEQERKDAAARRAVIPTRLTEVELFELRTDAPIVTPAMLAVALAGAVTRSPGRVLLPPALIALLAERSWVKFAFVGVLLVNLVLLAFANLDPRFSATWNVLHRLTFRAWARVVSALVILLGFARFADFQYVSTVFDGARYWTILGFVLFAYVLAWWWDYWTANLVAARFLDALRTVGGRADVASIDYDIRREVVTTRVPAPGRVIQLHGAGRLLVLNDAGELPFFHAWEPAEMADLLIDGADRTAKRELGLLRWKVSAHALLSAVALIGFFGAAIIRLNQQPQQPLIASSAGGSGRSAADLVLPAAACSDSGVIIALAASGGGTRAAIYTASALARIRRSGRLADISLVSGVSGGGAALAWFAARHEDLRQGPPPDASPDLLPEVWAQFFEDMQRPYIEDVIDGSGEWRITSGTRLGQLLAESFERHWRSTATFGEVTSVGILLNSAIAGRFPGDPRDPRSLADQEADDRSRGRSDVAGGRAVYTNLALTDHLLNRDLFDGDRLISSRDARLPVFVISDPQVPLASAVAANANFPPVFSNAAVDRADSLRLWVTDGGAIDNRGLETMLMVLRNAITGSNCRQLPALHIVAVEASAFSDSYRQDRGLGSMMSAGTAFASQLNSELLADIHSLYTSRDLDPRSLVRFHYVPMPAPLRRSGSFGTHWMLQERITVCEDADCGKHLELRGGDVVDVLRAAGSGNAPDDLSDAGRRLWALVAADTASEHSLGWNRLDRCLRAGRQLLPSCPD